MKKLLCILVPVLLFAGGRNTVTDTVVGDTLT